MPHNEYRVPSRMSADLFAWRQTDEPLHCQEEIAMLRTLAQWHLDNEPELPENPTPKDTAQHYQLMMAWKAGAVAHTEKVVQAVAVAAKVQAMEGASCNEIARLLDAIHAHMLGVFGSVKDAKDRARIEAAWAELRVIPHKLQGRVVLQLEAGE